MMKARLGWLADPSLHMLVVVVALVVAAVQVPAWIARSQEEVGDAPSSAALSRAHVLSPAEVARARAAAETQIRHAARRHQDPLAHPARDSRAGSDAAG
jgi:hypothetical protein